MLVSNREGKLERGNSKVLWQHSVAHRFRSNTILGIYFTAFWCHRLIGQDLHRCSSISVPSWVRNRAVGFWMALDVVKLILHISWVMLLLSRYLYNKSLTGFSKTETGVHPDRRSVTAMPFGCFSQWHTPTSSWQRIMRCSGRCIRTMFACPSA